MNGSGGHYIPTPRHMSAFKDPAMALGCVAQATYLAPKTFDNLYHRLQFFPLMVHFQTLLTHQHFPSGTFLRDPGCLGMILKFSRSSILPPYAFHWFALNTHCSTQKWLLIRRITSTMHQHRRHMQ